MKVLIPNYNREEELDNLLSQLKDFDVLVFSDGGKNNRGVCGKYDNVDYMYFEENRGLIWHWVRLLNILNFDEHYITYDDGILNADCDTLIDLYEKCPDDVMFGTQLPAISPARIAKGFVKDHNEYFYLMNKCISCPMVIEPLLFKKFLQYVPRNLVQQKYESGFTGNTLLDFLQGGKRKQKMFYWTKHIFYDEKKEMRIKKIEMVKKEIENGKLLLRRHVLHRLRLRG